jgi:hypothetical protein
MAVFTRTNGNAQNVVSVGNIAFSTEAASTGVPISTGIGKPLVCLGITANTSIAGQMGTGETVEVLLRWLGTTTTLLAYQVDTALLSVVLEEGDTTSFTAANANTAISGAGIVGFGVSTITNVGLKLATS